MKFLHDKTPWQGARSPLREAPRYGDLYCMSQKLDSHKSAFQFWCWSTCIKWVQPHVFGSWSYCLTWGVIICCFSIKECSSAASMCSAAFSVLGNTLWRVFSVDLYGLWENWFQCMVNSFNAPSLIQLCLPFFHPPPPPIFKKIVIDCCVHLNLGIDCMPGVGI